MNVLLSVVIVLGVLYRPFGDYMAWVFQTRTHWAPERVLYRLTGVAADQEQSWQAYLRAVLYFSLAGVLLLLFAWHLPPFAPSQPTTENAYVRGRVTSIAPQLSGYVSAVEVQDFQAVTRGQVIARIDDRIEVPRAPEAAPPPFRFEVLRGEHGTSVIGLAPVTLDRAALAQVSPPDGESFAQVAERVIAAKDQLVQEYSGQTVVVVSHVTPIKTLLQHALTVGPELLFHLHLDLASVSVTEFYPDGGSVVRSVNETAHLN